MLLTLQEGKNVISGELQELYDHSVKAKKRFGTSLAKYHSNMLIRKKTLAQHFIAKTPDIDTVLDEAYEKSKKIKITETKIDPLTLRLRTLGVGRFG